MKAYTTKTGLQQFKPALSDLQRVIEEDGNNGFCLACGEEQHGIEPDARTSRCESCGAYKVFGAEELLIMGLYHED
jgi:Zn finger protein HypA/HybF involved in hydrogenase expression